jgi:hypothetical protein
MLVSRRFVRRAARWLSSIGAGVAIAAQVGVAMAPIGEARLGTNSAPHVELGGTAVHHAHSDANCAVCQARATHAAVTRAATGVAALALHAMPPVQSTEQLIAPELRSLGNPRAPPAL